MSAFDAANPTVAARIPRELHARLLAESAGRGVPVGVLLREALEFRLGGLANNYDKGHDAGWNEAKALFAVVMTCPSCGKPLPVVNDAMKADAAAFLASDGWCHASCIDDGGA
jgi:hypothetical protein